MNLELVWPLVPTFRSFLFLHVIIPPLHPLGLSLFPLLQPPPPSLSLCVFQSPSLVNYKVKELSAHPLSHTFTHTPLTINSFLPPYTNTHRSFSFSLLSHVVRHWEKKLPIRHHCDHFCNVFSHWTKLEVTASPPETPGVPLGVPR